MGVGQVLDFYDSDHLYPSFGFGGTYRGSPTNHCFSLNAHPEGVCAGIPGILQAYRLVGLAHARTHGRMHASMGPCSRSVHEAAAYRLVGHRTHDSYSHAESPAASSANARSTL